MRILVDADACPVKEQIVSLAKQHDLAVTMFFDTAHVYDDGYSDVVIVDQGRDNVDYALINAVQTGDIVVSQDYGVATMALAKGAKAISQNGLIYTDDNILSLLNRRAFHQKMRRHAHLKGPKKRTTAMDEDFVRALSSLISSN